MNTSFIRLTICAFFLLSCKKSPTETNEPTVSLSGAKTERSTTASDMVFKVTLSGQAASDVEVNYETKDGTAIKDEDYLPASGSLIIAKGQASAEIKIRITGDSTRRANNKFSVQLINAKNAKIGTKEATGTIINENGLSYKVDNTGYATPKTYPGYTLAWSDEFEGSRINSDYWSYETGDSGWGNNELENYTNSSRNSFVSGGNLVIEARQEAIGTSKYTSARMITKNKKSFTYGRVDIRAKLPSGRGVWPALWLLGNNIDAVNWPACGEIDMMELLGHESNKIYGTLHWGPDYTQPKSYGTNYVLSGKTFDKEFHVFSMEWKKGSLKLYVDDVLFYTAADKDIIGANPFNRPFYFLFNVAVGGNWPGSPDNTTVFPQRMAVDYIRVFQQ